MCAVTLIPVLPLQRSGIYTESAERRLWVSGHCSHWRTWYLASVCLWLGGAVDDPLECVCAFMSGIFFNGREVVRRILYG